MNDDQKRLLRKAKENLDNTRDLLDVIMYSPDSKDLLTEEEYDKLRSIYNSVCEAIDKTY